MSIARLKEEDAQDEIVSDYMMANIVKEVLGEFSEEDEFIGENNTNAFSSANNRGFIEGFAVERAEVSDEESGPDVIEVTDEEDTNAEVGQPELTEEQL